MKFCVRLLLFIATISPATARVRVYKGHTRANVPYILFNNKVATETVTIYKYSKQQVPVWESSHTTWYDARIRDTLVVKYDTAGTIMQKVRTWYIGPTGVEYNRIAVFNAADSMLQDHRAAEGNVMVTSKSDSIYLPKWGRATYTYLPNTLIAEAVYYTAKKPNDKLRICYRYVFNYTYRSSE